MASFSNLDALLEEEETKSTPKSPSQSGGQAFSSSKKSTSSKSSLDALLDTPPPKIETTTVQAPAPKEKKNVFQSIGGGLKKAGTKIVELAAKGLEAGAELWNKQSQKSDRANFQMQQMMYGKNRIEIDPVTGKKTMTNDVVKRYQAAQTEEEKNAIIQEEQMKAPLIKAMNSPTGRKVLTFIKEKTSNIPLKIAAAVKSGDLGVGGSALGVINPLGSIIPSLAKLKRTGDTTYDEAYAALLEDRNNPENGKFKQFLYELQDSGVQSAIGVLLSLGTTYASRNPQAGRAIGMTYYTGISAAGQQEERGEVNSVGNIAIDVVGDQLLGTSLETVFKGGKGVLVAALKSAGIEGSTEVSQSLLKYGNDYGNARTQEEKDRIIAEAKRYVVEGGLVMEFAVGATAGGTIGAVAEVAAPTMTFDTNAPKKEGGEDKKEEQKAPILSDEEADKDDYYANLRDTIAEYEIARANGETVDNDTEYGKASEVRLQLEDYQTLNKDKTFFLPNQAEVEVVEYGDGNFSFRFGAQIENAAVDSPFINTQLYDSKQAATEAGLKEILEWIRTERASAPDVETRTALSALQDKIIEESQRGENNFDDIVAPINAERSAAKGDVITLESENMDELIDAETERLGGEPFRSTARANVRKTVQLSTGAAARPDQLVSKTQLRQLLGKSEALEMKVIEDRFEKYLSFESGNSTGRIKPSALGLVDANLREGQTVRITKEALKRKGSGLRARDTEGNAIGFIPSDNLRDEVYGEIEEKMQKTPRVSGRSTQIGRVARETSPEEESPLAMQEENLANVDTPAGKKEVEKIIKRSEIAAELSKKLAVPIRRGKYRGKALGIYKPKEALIRYKKGGLPTIFHEAGHFIDYTIFPFGAEIYKNKEEIKALTSEYGQPLNTPKRQKEEAFAEFLRFYMTEPAKAKAKAPIFSAFFENKMRALPEVSEVIEKAKGDFARWNEMPAAQKVLSQVSMTPDNETISSRFSSTLSSLYSQTIDDLNPIFKYSKLAEEKLGDLPAEENPYMLARNFRGWIGKANAFLETGTFGKKFWSENDKGKIVPNFSGKSFKAIVEPIEKAGALEDFTVYLISRRTIELSAREIETGVTLFDAQAASVELEQKHPEFKQAAKDLYKYQDDLLVFGKENGLYDEKTLEKIRDLNQAYIPFYRVMEEMETQGGVGKGFGNVRSNLKKIKGSDRDIINPLESIVKNTYAVINAAERNNVATAIVSLSSKDSALGQLVEKVATPMEKSATINLATELKNIFGKDPVLADVPTEVMDSIINVFRPSMMAKDNTITVLKDGKRLFYEVDPELYKAMQGLEVEHVGAVMKLLSFPARFLRAGATLTPEFVLRNPMRDQWSAFVYSKYNYVPFVDLARGMFSLFRKDSDYWLWRMGGGEHSMLASLDREYLTKSFDEVVKGKKFTDYVKNPLAVLQQISEYMEKGTRLGEAKAALRRSANPIDAAFAAREVTLDFARIGEKTKAINAIVAFFNAQVQGQDKMYRSFRDKPVRTLMKTFVGITLPSIILYFVNRDEEGWDEIPQWQKDLFWLIKVNDTWYRIPKPFELGVLFGSVPERILEYMDKDDPQLFKDLRESVTNGLTPSFIPTFMLPIIENMTNYNFFQERAIVPQSKTSLPQEAQYGNYTSETAKKLGELIKYSPAKIDNLLQGYFAGLGNYAVEVMDEILKGTGISNAVTAPAKELAEQPVLKAFIVKAPEGSRSNSVERFYTEWEKANEAYKYIKQLQNDGEDEKAYEFLAEHPEAELADYYNDVQKAISDMNKSRNEVLESTELSAEDKRDILKEIDQQMTIVAHNAIEMSLNYGEDNE